MTRRYFSQMPITGPEVTLRGPEAHHLLHVMRAGRGDLITLFDGSGTEFEAVVERLTRKEAVLKVIQREEIDRELPVRVTLAVALPKGDRRRWLVEKAVELGAAEVVPLLSERSADRAKHESSERLTRTVIEASKQCGRNRLMRIEEPRRWSDFLQETRDVPLRLLAHPNSSETGLAALGSLTLQANKIDRPGADSIPERPEIIAAVGPEGGFSATEIDMACRAGWQRIDLGSRILRSETAAVLLLGIISAAFLK